jgi:hypothetical protein
VHELVDRARLAGELAAVADGQRARDVRGVVVPLAAGVDEEDLREQARALARAQRGLVRAERLPPVSRALRIYGKTRTSQLQT